MAKGSVAAVVLAGGLSRRLGGGDKPLRPLAGKPILRHVLDRLAPQVERIAINANGEPERFASFGLPVIADTLPDFPGPLAGILAGMEWAAKLPGVSTLATVAGDTPFFPAELIERLSQVAQPGAIVLAGSAGQPHPTFGLWPLVLASDLREYVERGGRRVIDYVARHPSATVDFAGGGAHDPFFNINTPQDLAEAERLLAREAMRPEVIGITGWKNSGKTTLTERLVAELVRRGHVVSTVKHAHHDFDIDKPGADSFRHRAAGAQEVAIVSGKRWALMHELRGAAEPALEAVLARLSPCDLVLVEGYKREAHRKIETRRTAAKDATPLAADDPAIVAIAADHPVTGEVVPVFHLDDIAGIAGFIEALCKLKQR